MSFFNESFLLKTTVLTFTLGLVACSSDSSSSSSTGGSAGSTATGGSAGSTAGGNGGSTATGGSAGSTAGGNGGSTATGGVGGAAGGASGLASCDASTTYPNVVAKTCQDFCGGDGSTLGDGFLAECQESTTVPANVANTYGANVTSCLAACNALSQDQLCCRFGHLANVVSSGDAATHCPHAAGVSLCP